MKHEPIGAFADRIPARPSPTTEQLADDALLLLSKLRDRLVVENANIPACRVDEAIEITLAAARTALGNNLVGHDEGEAGDV